MTRLQAMRRLLVDHARTRGREKRCGAATSEAIEHGRKAVVRAGGVAAADPKNVYFTSELAQAFYELGSSLREASAASREVERFI